jgi:hypothetical protein
LIRDPARIATNRFSSLFPLAPFGCLVDRARTGSPKPAAASEIPPSGLVAGQPSNTKSHETSPPPGEVPQSSKKFGFVRGAGEVPIAAQPAAAKTVDTGGNGSTLSASALSARFAPSFRPAFHGRRSLAPGSYSECPIAFLLSAIIGQEENSGPSRSTPESSPRAERQLADDQKRQRTFNGFGRRE